MELPFILDRQWPHASFLEFTQTQKSGELSARSEGDARSFFIPEELWIRRPPFFSLVWLVVRAREKANPIRGNKTSQPRVIRMRKYKRGQKGVSIGPSFRTFFQDPLIGSVSPSFSTLLSNSSTVLFKLLPIMQNLAESTAGSEGLKRQSCEAEDFDYNFILPLSRSPSHPIKQAGTPLFPSCVLFSSCLVARFWLLFAGQESNQRQQVKLSKVEKRLSFLDFPVSSHKSLAKISLRWDLIACHSLSFGAGRHDAGPQRKRLQKVHLGSSS